MGLRLKRHPASGLAALLCLISLTGFSQTKRYTLVQYFEQLQKQEETFYLDVNNTLVLTNDEPSKVLRDKGFEVDDHNKVVINKTVFIKDVAIEGEISRISNGTSERVSHLFLDGFHFKESVIISIKGLRNLRIENCIFDHGFEIRATDDEKVMYDFLHNESYACGLLSSTHATMDVSDNKFVITPESTSYFLSSTYFGVKREIIQAHADSLSKLYGNAYSPLDDSENMYVACTDCDKVYFTGNDVHSTWPNFFMVMSINSDQFTMLNNTSDASFKLKGNIDNDLTMTGNKIAGYFIFDAFNFPDNGLIEWADLSDKIAIPAAMPPILIPVNAKDTLSLRMPIIYSGTHGNDDVLNKRYYNLLLYKHKLIHSTYVNRGNLEDANNCFVALKDLEAKRLKARLDEEPSFRNWIRYKLNRLMKFYTNHGTDPGLAVQVSVYLVLVFSFIYLFFPSDWDLESKAQLWGKFRHLKTQKGKSYWKSLTHWTYLFFLTVANAITLSLNVFVTLGFGNIPTHGVARYLCIVQGFLGWFLLSLFSVALINQILF